MLHVKQFIFNIFGETTYVVWDEDSRETAIIDPGMTDSNEENELDTFVAQNNLKIKYLIATHLHIDHAFGIPHVKEKYAVKLHAHKEETYLGAIMNAQAQMFGLRNSPGNIVIDEETDETKKLFLGQSALEIIHVPGHSPGSIVIYAPSGNFIIAGDVLFNGSIGRTDLPGGDYSTLIDGIKKNLMELPPETVVYPGHGPATTIKKEMTSNPFLA